MTEEVPGEDLLRKRAEEKVDERRRLVGHVSSYIIVNLFLWGLWLIIALTSDPFSWQGIWPIWVTLGWGIGLAFHVFNYVSGLNNESQREDQVQKEMDKLRGQQ
jgi:hypothetical protein